MFHDIVHACTSRGFARLLDCDWKVENDAAHWRMLPADRGTNQTMGSADVQELSGFRSDRHQFGHNGCKKPRNVEHRVLIPLPYLLALKRLVEIYSSAGAHHFFKIFNQVPLYEIPHNVAARFRRRSRKQTPSPERGETVQRGFL